jgi:membrane protease YdiL (CAAX protease family)
MKHFIKFIVVLFVILLTSAVLAPVLYHFLPFKFEKIFNRLVMVMTLAAVVAFVRIGRDTLNRYGLNWTKSSLTQFLTAFAGTVALLSLLLIFYVNQGCFQWHLNDLSWVKWASKLSGVLLTALGVSILEEFFFRGFVFQAVNNFFSGNARDARGHRITLCATIVVTNLFYSLLHFTSSNKPLIGPDPSIIDSFRLILAPFSSFGGWQALWPAAVGLLILGSVLNVLLLRSGALYPAIGMHAGCIFFIKLSSSFADFSSSPSLLFGSAKLYDGIIGWGVLIAIGVVLGGIIPVKNRTLRNGETQ